MAELSTKESPVESVANFDIRDKNFTSISSDLVNLSRQENNFRQLEDGTENDSFTEEAPNENYGNYEKVPTQVVTMKQVQDAFNTMLELNEKVNLTSVNDPNWIKYEIETEEAYNMLRNLIEQYNRQHDDKISVAELCKRKKELEEAEKSKKPVTIEEVEAAFDKAVELHNKVDHNSPYADGQDKVAQKAYYEYKELKKRFDEQQEKLKKSTDNESKK